ncbi:MAG: hypothetical protein M3Z27_04000 [Actinomycetota bacterium]|nr:hypothetical protein [Actinomycetota bacterium]
MGYKILGYTVWRVGKWYARRKMQASQRTIAIAGVSTALVAGAVVAGRAASGSDS